MRLKKGIAFLLIGVIMMARLQPVFPYLKQIPQIAQNLVHNVSVLYNGGKHVNLLADTNPADTDASDSKDNEKESEKEADKSFKEECKILPAPNLFTAICHTSANRTLFHLYVFGKTRNHIDEVFRPPLV